MHACARAVGNYMLKGVQQMLEVGVQHVLERGYINCWTGVSLLVGGFHRYPSSAIPCS